MAGHFVQVGKRIALNAHPKVGAKAGAIGTSVALVQVAFNLGNALGAYCGGLPIARGLGYEYTALPGAGFTLLGLLTAVVYIRKYPRHAKR